MKPIQEWWDGCSREASGPTIAQLATHKTAGLKQRVPRSTVGRLPRHMQDGGRCYCCATGSSTGSSPVTTRQAALTGFPDEVWWISTSVAHACMQSPRFLQTGCSYSGCVQSISRTLDYAHNRTHNLLQTASCTHTAGCCCSSVLVTTLAAPFYAQPPCSSCRKPSSSPTPVGAPRGYVAVILLPHAAGCR